MSSLQQYKLEIETVNGSSHEGAADVVRVPTLSVEEIARLTSKALEIRRSILTMVYEADSGHIGGSFSSVEIVVALYYQVMQQEAVAPRWPKRDRFILSKGHCAPVIYAVLADLCYFPATDLTQFRRPGSHLQGHPYQPKTPGIEASTGTLGIGLSTAMGMALGAKLRRESQFYYVLCGDGELQEGQIWEAAMFGNKYQLDNVIAFVDRNRKQTDGDTEGVMPLDPLQSKWLAFGWNVFEIDGHNFRQILEAIGRAKQGNGKPSIVIANTVKGKGVSFMENRDEWHSGAPTYQQWQQALEELHAL